MSAPGPDRVVHRRGQFSASGEADPPVVHSRPEQGWWPGPRRRQPQCMTPSASPAPATPPAQLRNPGELLAALPYLIGFHPRDSLLFIAFGGSSGRRIELTQRVDLPRPDDAAAVCGALAANTLRVSPAGVTVVVVGGDRAVAGGVP